MPACSNSRCTWPKPSESGRCLTCQALFIGTLVRHRYEIEKMVGKGGFGTTYLIRDQDCFNEQRILKELSPKPASNNDEEEDISVTAERLFKREAQVLLNLQHPGIPKLYAYFTENEYSYLVQDFIPGHTLAEEVDKQKRLFDENEARQVLTELADILEYLHTRTPPIVHRDIKPQNLMRHASGQLQLIDFGAVCQAASGGAATSQTLIGSPGYAPPEQIFGHPVPQSDLYAAGATVLRLISGVHPSQLFNNKTQRMEWETRVQTGPGLAAILNDLLARDVNKRLTSAAELKHRLEQLDYEPVKEAAPIATINPPAPTPSLPATPAKGNATLKFSEEASGQIVAIAQPKPAVQTSSPAETGELTKLPVLFLLRRFYRERFSGCLICIKNNISKTIYFEQGAVVFANSTLISERFGEMLMSLGRISRDDYDGASAVMRVRGLRFGLALIELGRITHDELKPLITEQVCNIIYSLFSWTSGSYEVWHKSIPEEEIKISISTADIIFEGLRRLENIDLIKVWLGDFTRKLSTTSDPLMLYQSVRLDPKEAFIVSRIENEMSVEEILSMGGLPEAETLKTLCGLLAVGILEWVDTSKAQRPVVPVANVLNRPQADNFDIQSAAQFCYEVENMLRSFENASHYAVLDIERAASELEIRESYGRLAKKFHPDRHAQFAKYNLSLRNELEKIFSRTSEAFRVLTDRRLREEYDRDMRNTGKIKVSSEVADKFRALYKNETPAQVTPPSTVPVARPAERQVDQSHPPTASPVRGERVTPPSFPIPKIPPRPESDSGKYSISRAGTPSLPSPHIDSSANRSAALNSARNWFQKGLEYYNAGQFGQACRAFQAAAAAAPQEAEYHIYLARSLALMKGYFTEAEQEFYKAIELAPKNADYYAELGLFYQKINLVKQADEMFNKAMEIVPDHPIARRAKRQ